MVMDVALDRFQSTDCSLELLNITLSDERNLTDLSSIARWNRTLTYLELGEVGVQNLDIKFASWVPFLRTLKLVDNSIRFLSDGVFYGLNHLEHLILKNNRLHVVPSNALKAFTRHRTLVSLDLSFNGIVGSIPGDAFAAVAFLRSLNMAGNRINLQEDWTAVLLNLTELYLINTYMHLAYAKSFPLPLQRLLLGVEGQDFFRMDIPICNLAKSLRELHLVNYQARETILANVIGKQCLHLYITDISGCFAHNNALHKEQFDIYLPRLVSLIMARSKINSLKQILFLRVPRLLVLDLSYNEIQVISMRPLPIDSPFSILEGNELISLSELQYFPTV